MKRKQLLVGYKIAFALLGFAALVTEIATLVERGRFNLVNFLSFFTVESNILAVIALLAGAFALLPGKQSAHMGRFVDVLRSFTTVFIVVVGVGFSFLLSGLENVALTAVPWDNTVLHYIIPAALVVDFLIDRPRTRMKFAESLTWLVFPLAYLGYTLFRGAVTGWYPYPFLNPAHATVGSIVVTSLALFVFGVVLIGVVALLTRHKPVAKV